jgi:acyl-CoA synthetase (AMP-forming)/AMP-acid ligase II
MTLSGTRYRSENGLHNCWWDVDFWHGLRDNVAPADPSLARDQLALSPRRSFAELVGHEVAEGNQEREVAGPTLFLGYLNRPDATAEVMHDGWLRAGDVAIRGRTGT